VNKLAATFPIGGNMSHWLLEISCGEALPPALAGCSTSGRKDRLAPGPGPNRAS